MPSRPNRGRHSAPRPLFTARALAVPAVLLATGGGAFAGLAGVPAVTGRSVVSTASAAGVPTTIALPRQTYAKDLDALDQSAARQQQAQLVQQRARAAAAERASRSRRAALDAEAKERAAAIAKAAADKAEAAETERKARLRTLTVRPATGRLSSVFGPRWGSTHLGVDIAAPNGSPVQAVATGEVVETGFDAGGYGNYVRVVHADGTMTTYNHMSRILRSSGQVGAGDLVGLVGSTGRSTGNHLHFEVRVGGTPVDPLSWLASRGISL